MIFESYLFTNLDVKTLKTVVMGVNWVHKKTEKGEDGRRTNRNTDERSTSLDTVVSP